MSNHQLSVEKIWSDTIKTCLFNYEKKKTHYVIRLVWIDLPGEGLECDCGTSLSLPLPWNTLLFSG